MATTSRSQRKKQSQQRESVSQPTVSEDASDHLSWLVIIFLAMFSGMAALTHEVLWTRRVIDVIGASNESSARVFGCFFLGLSLGAALASRFHLRTRTAWLGVGIAEFLVFLFALPGLLLFSWADSIWLSLGPSGIESWQGSIVKTLVPLIVVALPAVAMGMTLPWMATIVAKDVHRSSNRSLWLYGLNTIGGVIGIFVVTGWLLHHFGAQGSMWIAACVNLSISFAAIVFWWLCQDSPPAAAEPVAAKHEQDVSEARWLLFYSFASGFGVLSFEVLALHLALLVAPLSFYAPAAILATFVFCLAISSLFFPWLSKWGSDSRQLLGILFAASAISLGSTPFIFLWVAQFISFGFNASLFLFSLKLTAVILLTTGPAVLMMGFVFPAQLHDGMKLASSRLVARQWGTLLAMNGLGGLIGAETATGVLLPNLGVHVSIGIVSIFYALLFLSISLRDTSDRKGHLSSFILLAMCVWLVVSPLSRLPQMNPHLPFEVVDLRNGREGTVAVVEGNSIGRAIVMSNQYILGSSGVRWDEERQAHLPLVLHPDPKDVGFIGLATGITPGAALRHPEVKRLAAIELSPLVVSAADQYFQEFNYGITQSEKAQVVVEDGRIFMAAAQNEFDVIVGDLFLPWGLGEGRLYSREHFHAVRNALRPGGEYCQWLAMYQLTPEQFDVIVSTFREVFHEVYFFRSTLDSKQPALAMVGFRDGRLDWGHVSSRCKSVRELQSSLDPIVRHHEGIAMLSLGGVLDHATPQRNTLNNLFIELDASKQRVTGNASSKYLHGSRWLSFLNERYYRHPIPENPIGSLSKTGQLMSELELLQGLEDNRSALDFARRREVLQNECRNRMPHQLQNDLEADWSIWTGPKLDY